MIAEIGRTARRVRGGKVVLVTHTWHQHQQPSAQDADEHLLIQALQERGCATRCVAWNDPSLSWRSLVDAGSLILIRTRPSQPRERDVFLAWVDEVATGTLVLNSPRALRWNTYKRFLLDLARRGVPTLPGIWTCKGASPDLARLLHAQGWSQAVVKPVLASSTGSALLVNQQTIEKMQPQVEQWNQRHELLIQPWLPSVVEEGERSLLFIAGHFTHAVRKKAALVPSSSDEAPIAPTEEEVRLAGYVLEVVASCIGLSDTTALSSACVNLVRDLDGQWRVLDVELAKPRLSLEWSEATLTRLADMLAIYAREQSCFATQQRREPRLPSPGKTPER